MSNKNHTRLRAAKKLIAAGCVLAAVPFIATSPATAAGVSVTEANGDGPGSLPWAFEQASNDRSIRQINIQTDVNLCGPAVFDGVQPLSINGNGNEIYLQSGWCYSGDTTTTSAPGDTVAPFGDDLPLPEFIVPAILNFFTDANIRIRNLDIDTGGEESSPFGGIFIAMDPDARRAARHNFTDVSVSDVSNFGIVATDSGSNGSVYVTALRVDVTDVRSPFALNSIRLGGPTAGIGILESGPGVASLNLRNSTIEDIFGSGVLVLEDGVGNLVARLTNVTVLGNDGLVQCFEICLKVSLAEQEGIPVDCLGCGPLPSLSSISLHEADGGNLSVTSVNTRTESGNGGLAAIESGSGNLIARITNGVFLGSGNAIGAIAFDEEPIKKLSLRYGGDGVLLEENDGGGMRAITRNVESGGHYGDGVSVSEYGTGNLFADFSRTLAEFNSDNGVDFYEADGGRGTLRLGLSTLVDNNYADLCSNADVFRDFRNTIGTDCAEME